jgi:hypothetical protein
MSFGKINLGMPAMQRALAASSSKQSILSYRRIQGATDVMVALTSDRRLDISQRCI